MINWILAYLLIGLFALLFLVRAGRVDVESHESLKEGLGQVVLMSILAWPYVLFVWIFTFDFWLKPLLSRR